MKYKLIIFLLLISVYCNAQNTVQDYYRSRIVKDKYLSKVQQSIETGSFVISKDINSIEPCIFNFLSKLLNSCFTIANYDQPFNSTDVVNDTLPDRQLQVHFKGKNDCFVIYAHGGIGFHYHIAWFQLENNSVRDFWICNTNQKIIQFGELQKIISSFDRRIKLKDGRQILPDDFCL